MPRTRSALPSSTTTSRLCPDEMQRLSASETVADASTVILRPGARASYPPVLTESSGEASPLASVERLSGQPLKIVEEPRRLGDPPVLVARADKIRSVLGWRPRLDDLDTIVRTSLNWERQLQRNPW